MIVHCLPDEVCKRGACCEAIGYVAPDMNFGDLSIGIMCAQALTKKSDAINFCLDMASAMTSRDVLIFRDLGQKRCDVHGVNLKALLTFGSPRLF